MKNITDRHEFILQKVKEDGKVNIFELIESMGVSGVTIRKDLKLLENKNLLFRTRGGASVKNPYANEKITHSRASTNSKEKQKIAKAALQIIGANNLISLGSGSTIFELAKILQPFHQITAITPSLKIGIELSAKNNIEVLQLGGILRPNSTSVYGTLAERMLSEISCGILFISVDGIDLDFGFSIANLAETTLNQKFIEMAQTVVVLADSSKFNKRELGKISGFDNIDYIISDEQLGTEMIHQLEEKGIKVIIA